MAYPKKSHKVYLLFLLNVLKLQFLYLDSFYQLNKETNNCVTIVKDCRTNLLKLIDESKQHIEESKKYTDLSHKSLERKAKSIQVMEAVNKEAPPSRRRRTSYSDLAPGLGFSRSPIQQDLFEKSPIDDVLLAREEEYKTEVRRAKRNWLEENAFPFDHFHGVQYGATKADSIRRYLPNGETAILIDDNAKVRNGWHMGEAIDPTACDIVEVLRNLLN